MPLERLGGMKSFFEPKSVAVAGVSTDPDEHGYRGGPKANVDRLAKVISSFSRIVMENLQIEQMEVNPLMVRGDDVLAVDVRVILGHGK